MKKSWSVFELGEIVEIKKNKYNPKKEDKNYPCIELEHMNQVIGSINGYTRSIEQSSIKNRFSKGDVLYGKLRPYLRKYYLCEFDGVCSSEIWVLNGKKVENKFLYYLVQGDKFNNIANVSTGSKMPRADWSFMEGYPFMIPPKLEQEKIAEILAKWDLAIEKQEQLIEKKKEFKKGLMQKLLSGEVRFKEFKEKWNNKALENYIIPVIRECDKPSEGYWRLGLRSHGKGTFHEFVEDPSTVSMDKLYKVKCNDLIVNITFAWEHAIAVANSMDEDKLVSHRFPTYEFKDNAYPLFFKHYILQPKFKHMLVNISPGGAGRNRVMSKKEFLNLIVKIPSYNEQVRIAEVLTGADKEVELLQKELEILKFQKKGLMKRLLNGEVRVSL